MIPIGRGFNTRFSEELKLDKKKIVDISTTVQTKQSYLISLEMLLLDF